MFRYSRTCKYFHYTVSSYLRRKHKLETVLGKYFTDDQILHFRHLQATTGMIISGSTALQFFERVLYPDSDLDLYVEYRYMRLVALWLASIGYRYVPARNKVISEEQDDAGRVSATQPTLKEALAAIAPPDIVYPIHGYESHPPPRIFFYGSGGGYLDATAILNFAKRDEFHEHSKIQLISASNSPVEMVLNFHSSMYSDYRWRRWLIGSQQHVS